MKSTHQKEQSAKGFIKAMGIGIAFVLASDSMSGSQNLMAQDMRLVKPAITYEGTEVLCPRYIDADSALKTTDGYIVFLDGCTIEITKGPRKGMRVFQGKSYRAIHCEKKRWAESQGRPVFETSWRDYTKNEVYQGTEVYDNDWPRNVEKVLCRKPDVRSVPHRAGEIMFLNYSKKNGLTFSPLEYDKAVELGILK